MKYTENRVVIWQGWLFLIFPAVCLTMVVFAAASILPYLAVGELLGWVGVLAYVILALFFGILLFLAYTVLRNECQTVVVDAEGVRRRGVFSGLELGWGEIGEYGFVVDGTRRGNFITQSYILYFSREPQDRTRLGRLRLRGDVIRVRISGMQRESVLSELIPLCEQRSMVRPRIDS